MNRRRSRACWSIAVSSLDRALHAIADASGYTGPRDERCEDLHPLLKHLEGLRDTGNFLAAACKILGLPEGASAEDAELALIVYGAQVRADEREACCAILASAEPNTRAERILLQLHGLDLEHRDPDVARLVGELCDAVADELEDLEKLIRARGAGS